ncbi:MAG: DNA methylase [Planctomycetota bacterium]
MARSPAHKFGQIIGELVEAALREPLAEIAAEHGLYLDFKHPRPARGGKRKVAWRDTKGNEHDLDYVLEAGGSEDVLGRPRAFVEIAWRRYTKHSRNKAQEIQAAIMPLAETYSHSHPFLGVVLAGVFTEGSVAQLRSHGFRVLYYPYDTITSAFAVAGVDARFNESTPDAVLGRRIKAYLRLGVPQRHQIVTYLRESHNEMLTDFLSALRAALKRRVQSVYIIPLHGSPHELPSVDDAIAFLQRFDESVPVSRFIRYEVAVRYSNGDEIRGSFENRLEAILFLKTQS